MQPTPIRTATEAGDGPIWRWPASPARSSRPCWPATPRPTRAAARQYGVNPVFIVADNGGYGTIVQHHDLRYPGRPYRAATQLTNPDFALWATAFGAKGMTIREEAEVEPVSAWRRRSAAYVRFSMPGRL
jgi:hypothetical protein